MSYSLHVYRANERKVDSPIPNEESLVVPWLIDNAECLGSIDFEIGECFAFFKALFILTKVDLLPLIGGSVHEEPSEEEYCCGTLTSGALERAVETLHSKLQSDSIQLGPECCGYLQTQGISEEWFLQVLTGLLKMLQEAGSDTVIGLFE